MGKTMKNFEFKFVNFLANNNTIKVTNEEEFDKFVKILEHLNMKGILGKEQYYNFDNWQILARINNRDVNMFLFEYNNYKGLTWGDNEKDSISWYGMEPYTVDEILEELNLAK